jgi:predicted PurR-regulated permease PerM
MTAHRSSSEPSQPSKLERSRPDITNLGEFLRGPVDVHSIALTGIFLLLFFYTLYFGRDFFLPVTLALILSFLLVPLVRGLARFYIPYAIGASLVLVVVLGITSYGVYQLSEPVSEWIAKGPQSLRQVQLKLRQFKQSIDEVNEAAKQVEQMTNMGENRRTQTVQVERPGLGNLMLTETQEFLVGSAVMVVLLFFLLSSGDLFLRKLVRVLPRLQDKKLAVEIMLQIEEDISTYLLTVTLINVGVGLTISLAFFFLGMPSPVLWGVMATLLNFIPYLGALAGIVVVTLVAILTFDTIGQILLVPGVYFVLNIIEANFVTPVALGRRLTFNPVVIFLWVIFWGWLWGAAGALVAVPLLAILKIVCDQIEPLAPIGEFLGQ